MLVEFNKEKAEELLFDFYQLTHISVSLWDAQLNQLAFQPTVMPAFCKIIKQTKCGNQACLASDKKIIAECAASRAPATHICHAGLCDTAVPLLYEDEIIGYIMFGQIKYDGAVTDAKSIQSFAKQADIDVKTLLQAYRQIQPITTGYLQSATRILSACTNYLVLSDIIKINKNSLPAKIDNYINSHIKERITVDGICTELYISKSKLYLVFKSNFDCTFGEYVVNKRIKLAKNLLALTDMPIYEVCGSVGINDYNYFIKVFKKQTGYSPLVYRKTFPFNINKINE